MNQTIADTSPAEGSGVSTSQSSAFARFGQSSGARQLRSTTVASNIPQFSGSSGNVAIAGTSSASYTSSVPSTSLTVRFSRRG